MLAELGFISLLFVTIFTACLTLLPAYGIWRKNSFLMQLAQPLSLLYAIFTTTTLVILAYAFATNDFSLEYVAQHSNSHLPLFYQIAATWGGHEGSMLFWLFSLSIWTGCFAWFNHHTDPRLITMTLSIMGLIGFCFALFILGLSNPFQRLFPAALEGRDLNPMLQDIGLIVHPPLLYLGYVGFAINFALIIASLITQQFNAALARLCRPWVLASWAFLTVGIILGSWWAYYELGWGGWWFWDPVENASLMPWLLATGLLHGLIIYEKRGILIYWVKLLSIFTFALSLLGTFIVRSGVLASVHAFTIDPQRGHALLAIFFLFTVGGLILFALRANNPPSIVRFHAVSKESALLITNILFALATLIVFVGTFYPMIFTMMGWGSISVGTPYFNRLFLPLLFLLLGLMIFAPQATWQKLPLAKIKRASYWVIPAIMLTFLQIWQQHSFQTIEITSLSPIATSLLILAWWMLFNTLFARWYFDLKQWGMRLAHIGLAISVIGGTISNYYAEEISVRMKAGDTQTLHQYQFTYLGYRNEIGPNYTAEKTFFAIHQQHKPIAQVSAERRFYDVRTMNMSEVGIVWGWFQDLYIVMGNKLSPEEFAFRLHYKPYIRWLWFGGLLVMLGGFLAMWAARKPKLKG
ncbi:heme lyase CcmF/NrfE family subunit [Gallibacterium genomosp. 3]|uniref:Cytochrome C biogenesis protein CcmF n=1 Tax=Gallibacterium genomosp. 3 TaxID=505345 RepID=A0A1A7QA57_9PAST|nr:heme lyase CcmF/NrfE family subunit [Gallibacterium genomosp. 3]OBX11768.1 cytochrome C biogenesis protein CcmF [Gallibacterium genomosp. 3]